MIADNVSPQSLQEKIQLFFIIASRIKKPNICNLFDWHHHSPTQSVYPDGNFAYRYFDKLNPEWKYEKDKDGAGAVHICALFGDLISMRYLVEEKKLDPGEIMESRGNPLMMSLSNQDYLMLWTMPLQRTYCQSLGW